MPKTKVRDIEIYYEVHGQGPAVFLITGYNCNLLIWESCLKFLTSHFKLFLIDNRGSGRSDAPDEPYTIDQMAIDVIDLAHDLNVKSYSILGHSMGGAIAQTVAYKDPHRVQKLIVANSSSKFSMVSRNMLRFFLHLKREKISDACYNEGIIPLIYSNHFMSDEKKMGKLAEEKNPYPMSYTGLKNQLYAIDHFNSQPFLTKIRAPTLVITSEEDILTSPNESQFLAEKISNAQIYSFKNMSHAPLIEEPEKFSSIVSEFLNSL